jgi:hypothetical protein
MRVVSRSGAPIRVFSPAAPTALRSPPRPAPRGTRIRRIAVHFCPALAVISRWTSFRNRSNSGVPGTASGPRIVAFRLSCSATKRTAPLRSFGRRPQGQRRGGRAREADHILPVQPVQKIAQIARDQLHRAFGQDAAFQHDPHRRLGHVAARRRRFHDRGHARQKRRRKFFQHPPDGKVEGVDMDRDPLQRRADMLPHEAALRDSVSSPPSR